MNVDRELRNGHQSISLLRDAGSTTKLLETTQKKYKVVPVDGFSHYITSAAQVRDNTRLYTVQIGAEYQGNQLERNCECLEFLYTRTPCEYMIAVCELF